MKTHPCGRGLSSAVGGSYNKNWQGWQLFPTVGRIPPEFSQKVLTSASLPPTSFNDVEAKMCGHIYAENHRTQLILTLGENHVSFEFKFRTMIGTQVAAPFQYPSVVLTVASQ